MRQVGAGHSSSEYKPCYDKEYTIVGTRMWLMGQAYVVDGDDAFQATAFEELEGPRDSACWLTFTPYANSTMSSKVCSIPHSRRHHHNCHGLN
jgi:hypothetical protein